MTITPQFRRGGQEPVSGGTFTATSLPDEQKRDLCRSLLAEFGVTSVQERDGELIHSCCLPFGAHRNGDRNPSASLNYRKLTYNCLGCGNSGGLLWFVGVCRGDDSAHARGWLDQQLGLTDDEEGLANFLRLIDALYSPDKESRRPPPIPRMDARVLDKWRLIHPYLTDPRSEGGRGIPVETLIHFNVGYGTFRVNIGDADGENWVTSERIVIPHFWRGDLVGWQTRRLGNDGTPKYKSSADMPKDTTIFNYSKHSTAVVVESPMSVLSKYHCCPGMMATFGAKVTDRQIRLLSAYDRVVLFMDNDTAGWSATHHLGEALSAHCPVSVVDSDWAADPADMDDETFAGLLADPVPYALWAPPTELRPWDDHGGGER